MLQSGLTKITFVVLVFCLATLGPTAGSRDLNIEFEVNARQKSLNLPTSNEHFGTSSLKRPVVNETLEKNVTFQKDKEPKDTNFEFMNAHSEHYTNQEWPKVPINVEKEDFVPRDEFNSDREQSGDIFGVGPEKFLEDYAARFGDTAINLSITDDEKVLKMNVDLKKKELNTLKDSSNWINANLTGYPNIINNDDFMVRRDELNNGEYYSCQIASQDLVIDPLESLFNFDQFGIVDKSKDTNDHLCKNDELELDFPDMAFKESLLQTTDTCSTTSSLLPVIKSRPLQTDPYKKILYWEHFFIQSDCDFDSAIILNFKHDERIVARDQLCFMTKGALGILVTQNRILISPLVKLDDWQVSEKYKPHNANDFITEMEQSQLINISKTIPGQRQKCLALKQLESLNYKGNLNVLWIQTLGKDGLAYINQLEESYSIYVLDDGELIGLGRSTENAKFLDAPTKGNRYLIIISSFAIDIVSAAIGFKENEIGKLCNLLWGRIEQKLEQEPRLIVVKIKIKMKDPSSSRHASSTRPETPPIDENKGIVNVNENKYIYGMKLERVQFKSMTEMSVAKVQPFIVNDKNSQQLNPSKRLHPWSLASFSESNSAFVEIMISKMRYKRQKEAVKSLTFMTEESPGIMIANMGLLVSHLVKLNSWKLPKTLKETFSSNVCESMENIKLTNICSSLSRRLLGKIKRRFDYLTFSGTVSVLWFQLFSDGSIAYSNQLKDLYQLYILDNGNLVKLTAAENTFEIYKPSSEIKFVIMISSFVADVLDSVIFESSDENTKKLYDMVRKKVGKKYGRGQKAELIIIKMKKILSDNPILSGSKSAKEMDTNQKETNVGNKERTKKTSKLGNSPSGSVINTLDTSTQTTSISTINRPLVSIIRHHPWVPSLFASYNGGIVEIMTSKMDYKKQRRTNRSLNFMKKESPGIIITPMGLLMNDLVKLDSWKFLKKSKKTFPNELIERVNSNKLCSIRSSLYRRISHRIQERFNSVTFKGKIPTMWIQLLENESLVHVNQLGHLYQIHILDNGKLVKLANADDKAQVYEMQPGSKFIIMTSSFVADAVNVASEFEGDDLDKLFTLLWGEIVQKFKQKPESELVVIKMKEISKDESFQIDLQDTEKVDGDGQMIKVLGNEPMRNKSTLEYTPFKQMVEIFSKQAKTSTLTTSLSTRRSHLRCPEFFSKNDTGFIKMMISRMEHKTERETNRTIKFVEKESLGILVTHVGLLISYSVKIKSWKLPKILGKVKNTSFSDIGKTLSSRISKKTLTMLNSLSCNNTIPIIWMQLLINGDIVYVNQLEKFYRIYILNEGRLVELVNAENKVKTYAAPPGNKFIIVISSFVADAVDAASDFNKNDIKELYDLVWKKVEQKKQHKQNPELVIIKMKKDLDHKENGKRKKQSRSEIGKEKQRKLEDKNFIRSFNFVPLAVFQSEILKIADSCSIFQSQSQMETRKDQLNIPLDNIQPSKTTGKKDSETLSLTPSSIYPSKVSTKGCHDWDCTFGQSDGIFTSILVSKKKGKWNLNEAGKRATFVIDGSYGILFTPFGLLINYLVKRNAYKLPEKHELAKIPEFREKFEKNRIDTVYNALAKPVIGSKNHILKKLGALSVKNALDSIWVQCIDGGGIAYTNQLPDVYRTFMLVNERLFELIGDGAAIDELPEGNKFIILISTFVAGAARFAIGFKENNAEKLFALIWDNIDKRGEQAPELIVIKMKNDQ